MLKIEKTSEPIFFQKVRENPKVRKWEDVPPEIKKELMFIYMNCLSTGFIKEFDKYIDEFPSLIHYYLKSYNRDI